MKNNNLRSNQLLENYLKVTVGMDVYNHTKYDKIQLIGTTIIKYPKTGGYLLQNWVIKSDDKNNNGKTQHVIKSTKTSCPSGHSGIIGLPPFGNSFMYIETSPGNNGNGVFVTF